MLTIWTWGVDDELALELEELFAVELPFALEFPLPPPALDEELLDGVLVRPEPVLRGNACVSKDIRNIEYGTMGRHPSGPALREREFRQRPISTSAFV